MTEKITYGKLYSDMVKLFAVKQDGKDDICLGDYMRSRATETKQLEAAKAKRTKKSNLPVAAKQNETRAITAFFSYVNERLTVKQAPVRDKTIRRFPLRTALSSAFCAFIICAVMALYGIVGIHGGDNASIANEPEYEYSEDYTTTLGFDEYEDIF